MSDRLAGGDDPAGRESRDSASRSRP